MIGYVFGTCLLLLTAPSKASQDRATLIHNDAGIEIQLPSNWLVETDDELVFASNASSSLMMAFITANNHDINRLIDSLGHQMAPILGQSKLDTKPSLERINGLPHLRLSGSAQKGAQGQMDVQVTVVVGVGKSTIVLAMGTLSHHASELRGVYDSIRLLTALADTI